MAEISKITLPNAQSYDLKDASARLMSGIYTVKGTQTTSTGSWQGTIPVSALTDGLTIAYYLPRSGNGNATLNLTLSDDTTTGAIDVYLNGSTRINTQFPAGSMITLTYWSANSISINGTTITSARWISNVPDIRGGDIEWGELDN